MSTRLVRRGTILIGALLISVVVTAGASGGRNGSNPYHLLTPGTLVVGMNLEGKPQMYLKNGKPAGYDVVLLKALATSLHLKLKIDNLDFPGLIPGLVSKKFDMVSVGLTPTPARKKAVSFSRSYVPYELVLAVAANSTIPATMDAWNTSNIKIGALEGSSDAQLAQSTFPQAQLVTETTDTSVLLDVATGHTNGAVIENYYVPQYNKSNSSNSLKIESFPKPLDLEYGSWAVQHGNTALVNALNRFLCTSQKNGVMAKAYQAAWGAPIPHMPGC